MLHKEARKRRRGWYVQVASALLIVVLVIPTVLFFSCRPVYTDEPVLDPSYRQALVAWSHAAQPDGENEWDAFVAAVNDLWNAVDAPKRSVSRHADAAERSAVMLETMERNPSLERALVEAMGHPRYIRPFDLSTSVVDDVIPWNERIDAIVGAWQRRAIRSAMRQAWGAMHDDLDRMFRIGRILKQQPDGSTRSRGRLIHDSTTIATIVAILHLADVPVTECDALEAVIIALPAPDPAETAALCRLEILDEVQRVYGSRGYAIPVRVGHYFVGAERSIWQSVRCRFYVADWEEMVACIDRFHDEVLQCLETVPTSEQGDCYYEPVQVLRSGRYDPLGVTILPFYRVARGSGWHQSMQEKMRLLLAIERFTAREQRIPTTLNELVPEYVDAIPNEATTGLPYHYRVRDDFGDGDQFLLYTLGRNGEDDVGRNLQDERWRVRTGELSAKDYAKGDDIVLNRDDAELHAPE